MEAGFLLYVLSSACISWYIFSTLFTIFRPIKSTLYSVFYIYVVVSASESVVSASASACNCEGAKRPAYIFQVFHWARLLKCNCLNFERGFVLASNLDTYKHAPPKRQWWSDSHSATTGQDFFNGFVQTLKWVCTNFERYLSLFEHRYKHEGRILICRNKTRLFKKDSQKN